MKFKASGNIRLSDVIIVFDVIGCLYPKDKE